MTALRARIPAWLVVSCIALIVLSLVTRFESPAANNYVFMADAWLHGTAYLPITPGAYIDWIPYRGHAQLVEAPMPGVLMLPLVALYHLDANQMVLSIVLGAIAIGAAWLLCERLRTSLAQRVALVAFFTFGTSFFWCAVTGDVWFLAHVGAVAFTMLALAEVAGKRRGWLVGSFAIAAGLCRFPFFLALPFYFAFAAPVAERWYDGRRGLCLLAAAGLAAWVWDNEARWGTVSDIGLSVLYHQSVEKIDHVGAPFSLANVPKQVRAYFLTSPTFSSRWPWVSVPLFGIGIDWTSPALLAAFFVRKPWRLVTGLWLLAIAIAIPNFIYFSAGDAQFGMRHALDFEPFLFVLMILAVRERRGVFLRPLFAYSIAFGIWGVWFWRTYPPGFGS